ncbi:MAG: carbon storage regulator CsrA [Ignavibacteriaceae bacterium]|nr:carbon storage regulator CsrA [Ignavibacteriaceae bacterium]
MLILTRKLNEEIVINSNIRVKIISIADNQVKIGIEAPSNVEILRGELYEKAKESAIEASKLSSEKTTDFTKFKVNKLSKVKNEQ